MFISGISCGAVSVISPMYIADISDVSMRGILGSFFEFLIYTGVILVSVCGAYVHYITLTIILGFCSLIIGLAFLFFPESPTYLLKIGQKDKATIALKYYRSVDYDVSKDIDQLLNNFQHLHQNKLNIKKLLTTKCVVRGLVACVGLTLFQQLSGVDAIIFYSVQVFDEADTGLNSYMLAIILSIFQLLSAVLIVFIIEKADRRVFLFISTFGCGASSAMLGVYFNLKDKSISFLGFNYIPLVCMIIHSVTFAFGLGPIPWLMNGDLFPHEVKGVANGIIIFSNWIFLFVVTKTFPISMEDIGRCFPFYFYSMCMVICLMFINYCIPETRGKTLDQIQVELNS
ncbi:hypothetical protein FQR65_LT05955 [Abscondita terminalis]|nr:hypothetical protein FQR65_LT05955 [Abscondita terminalis]